MLILSICITVYVMIGVMVYLPVLKGVKDVAKKEKWDKYMTSLVCLTIAPGIIVTWPILIYWVYKTDMI